MPLCFLCLQRWGFVAPQDTRRAPHLHTECFRCPLWILGSSPHVHLSLQLCFRNLAWNFTLLECINALFKIEVSSDNGSYFYGLIHLHIWSQHEISSQHFKIAKSYPSSAPLICAVLHDINIYTITVTILQWPKLSHFKGSIFKEHNTLMEMQL